MDLPGFGISDRPAGFGYSLEEHADALTSALDAADVRGAEIVGHSMGGAVAIVLATRRPELVARLILANANLDPDPPVHHQKDFLLRHANRGAPPLVR